VWEEILTKGTVRFYKSRRYIHYNGKRYIYAVVLWNYYYPQNPAKRGEVIHHIDEDKRHDEISNYAKMTISQHMKIHSKGSSNPLYGRKHSEETLAKMRRSAHIMWKNGLYDNRKKKAKEIE
jgi:hypothetical protein